MQIRLFFALLIFSSLNIRAQDTVDPDTTSFYRMSLEQLMNVNVTVASQSPMTSRESPGIVSILTHSDIVNSGANDLMQLLQLYVPGVDFGVDVDGVVGIGIRGNWAHEGKVLLLWDGMEMNEDLYSTLQFGNHYPLDQIRKVEIIRGPGSAMYGGNAEYAVINITTLNGKDFDGVSASTNASYMSETFANKGITAMVGQTIGQSHVNFAATYSSANRSQETYTDAEGNSFQMKDQSGLATQQYRMDFYFKGFSITGMFEDYEIGQRDGYGSIYNRPYETKFDGTYLVSKYEFKPSTKFTITPGIRFKHQTPWNYSSEVINDNFAPYNISVNKCESFVNTSYEANDYINVIGGINYYSQNAHQEFDTVNFSNGTRDIAISNYTTYAQGIFKTKPINVILGARYEHNTSYGSSFVPRFGLTKVWDKFHLKALYSKAFRAPSIENIDISPDISPENTTVIEFEAGLKLMYNCYLTANIYDITTKDPIIYYYDEMEFDKYINKSSTGSRGFDVDCKWKFEGWLLSFAYSYSTTAGHNVIDVYKVPGHEKNVLAFPSHELNIVSNVHLSKSLNFSPSLTFMGTRYSYLEDQNSIIGTEEISPSLYMNINFNVNDIFCKGLMLQAGCFNLSDEKTLYIQPYNGNHRPLPGQGRQFQLKFRYNISFDKN
jgi:outer membrane cobalamin receptor